jgi:hypothetical protein
VATPLSVGVLDNGMIVVNMFDACYVYDAQTGKQKKKVEDFLGTELTTDGNKFVLCKGNDGEETITSLSVFDAEKLDSEPEKYKRCP